MGRGRLLLFKCSKSEKAKYLKPIFNSDTERVRKKTCYAYTKDARRCKQAVAVVRQSTLARNGCTTTRTHWRIAGDCSAKRGGEKA
jgi:hypothetical protein